MLRSGLASDVLDMLDRLYAATLEPAQWHEALGGLAALLDARAAGIRFECADTCVEQRWFGLNESFNTAYVEHYWQYDPWVESGRHKPMGTVAYGDALTPRSVVEASPFHAELALPNGFDDLVGAVLERTPARLVTLGAMKGVGRRRFKDKEARLMLRVLPHFQRAVVLTEQLANQRVLDAPRPGVIEILRRKFRLTPTEVRVAVCVAKGLCPKEIAALHGTSWNTVRAQLRAIFAKTETGSQRVLAQMIVRMEIAASRAYGLSRPP